MECVVISGECWRKIRLPAGTKYPLMLTLKSHEFAGAAVLADGVVASVCAGSRVLQRAATTNIPRRNTGVIVLSSRGLNPLLGRRYSLTPSDGTRSRFTISMRPSVIGAQSYHGNVTGCPLANKTVCADLTGNVCETRWHRRRVSGMPPVHSVRGVPGLYPVNHNHPSSWVFHKC